MNADFVTVRCHKNKYSTPLFSFDVGGVYVRCKDCRDLKTGKRGVYHKFSWREVGTMFLGLWRQPHNAFDFTHSGSNYSEVEERLDSDGDHNVGDRDQGGPVDRDRVQLPFTESAGDSTDAVLER